MAAAISGVIPVCLDKQPSCVEDVEMKKKQLLLMEKLRSKRSSQHRSWTESLKTIRTAVVDRRLQTDSLERTQVQKCLDTLQRAMKVISQQSLVERLESVARQQALSFHTANGDQPSVTLQGDMFHVEIVLNKGGGVKEVKVAHQGDANVCHELTDILSRGDFSDFTTHLEGLQNIYKVTGEKKLKSKAFLALQSLERDLNQLAQFQNSISGVANYIHKSPLGILLPRSAGKPMKLIYFVSPYDLLDKNSKSAHAMTVEAITEHGLGRSVTVCLEAGPSNKLQTMPLLTVNKTQDGKSLPSFTGLTHMNSAMLPACFVLVLPQPIPVASCVVQKIHVITKLEVNRDMGTQPLLSLILDSNSDGKMKKGQQLFVNLPDQHHVYFINGVSGGILDEPGVMLSRIPFTHPTHVPQILNLLRQQLLFNSILASCVRPCAKKDLSTSMVFELTGISLHQLMVVFEHPAYDTMVTVDVDLSDITNLKCRMLCTSSEQNLCSDDYASRVLQRCLSLPILLRSLVRRGRMQLEKLMEAAAVFALEQARQAQEAALWAAQVKQRIQPTNIPTKGRPPPPQPPPQHPPTYSAAPSPVASNPPSVGGMGEIRGIGGNLDFPRNSPASGMTSVNVGSLVPGGDNSEKLGNTLLVNLLDGDQVRSGLAPAATTSMISESPMLSRLLDDNISVATNINPIPIPSVQQKTTKRVRKRRSQAELPIGRSPKHRASDSESIDRISSIDLDSSTSPFDSNMGAPVGLASFSHLNSVNPHLNVQGQQSSVIDLTDESMTESSLKKLVDSVDNFMHKEGKPSSQGDSELSALLSDTDRVCSPSSSKTTLATGQKNENASTSPEGVLKGSGEVGKASLSDPLNATCSPTVTTVTSRSSSHVISSSMTSLFGSNASSTNTRHDNLNIQNSGPVQLQQDYATQHQHRLTNAGVSVVLKTPPPTGPRPKVVSSSSMTDIIDFSHATASGKKSGLKSANSADSGLDKRAGMPGLFEKFEFTGESMSSDKCISVNDVESPLGGVVGVVAPSFENEEQTMPKMRLKLHTFRPPHGKSQSLDSSVAPSPSSAGSKSSNSNAFDFRSDEEDEESIPMNYVPAERLDRLSVYSSSPTRLQISTKAKPSTPSTPPETSPSVKPEKYKRKDKSGSGNSNKRKKDRDDSRKEKKKKKFQHDDSYHPSGKETVYRAAIEGDQKYCTKLKIRVSKEHLIKTPSPLKDTIKNEKMERNEKLGEKLNDGTKRCSSSPLVEKLVLSKQDLRELNTIQDVGRDRMDTSHSYSLALSSTGKSPKMGSGKSSLAGSNSALSKADPKLAKATIRLKPLNMAATTSTSVNLTPPVKTSSGGRAGLERTERRSQSGSSTPSVSTSSNSTLTLSSILPNAPTAISVASLPPIPKLSSSSSSSTSCSTSTTASTASKSAVNSMSVSVGKIPSSGVNSSLLKSGNNANIGSTTTSSRNVVSSANISCSNTKFSNYGSNIGSNKVSGMNGPMQKISTGPSGLAHKMSANTNVSGGAQKFQGIAGQSTGAHKLLGMQNQFMGSPKITSTSNQSGGQQKSSLSNQSSCQKSSGMVTNATGISPRGNNALSNSAPKVPTSISPTNSVPKLLSSCSQAGSQQKSPNIQSQSGTSKMVISASAQNSGLQKVSSTQGTGGQKVSSGVNHTGSLQRTSSGGNISHVRVSQNNSMHNNASQKSQGTGTISQGQKVSSTQNRSLSASNQNTSPNVAGKISTSGQNTSPNVTGKLPGGLRNSSVSGNNSRTPPNHLPIHRSMSAPGQRSNSGSSPRMPAGQSPSTPTGSRFPNNSPQKNASVSPSSSTLRSSSISQGSSSQRSGNVTQPSSQRQSGTNQSSTRERPSHSPQSSQRLGGTLTNQRPASTPGVVGSGEHRAVATSGGSSSAYPVRPSSAGPRQGSSPSGSKSNTSPSGSKSSSSPSGHRTSSPIGHRQSTGNHSGIIPVISPLASGLPLTTLTTEHHVLSRQNSGNGSNAAAVSRQSSSGGFVPVDEDGKGTTATSSNIATLLSRPGSGASTDMSTDSSLCSEDTPGSGKSDTLMSSGSITLSRSTSNSGNVNKIISSKGTGSNKMVPTGDGNLKKTFNSKLAANSIVGNIAVSTADHSSAVSEGINLSAQSSLAVVNVNANLSETLSVSPLGSKHTASSSASSAGTSVYMTPSCSAATLAKLAAAPRGRKGSLSAIVNKLATRICAAVSGPGSEGGEISTGGLENGVDKIGIGGDSADTEKLPSVVSQTRHQMATDSEIVLIANPSEHKRQPVKRTASFSSETDQKVQRLDTFNKLVTSSGSTSISISSPSCVTSPYSTSVTLTSALNKGKSVSVEERNSPVTRESGSLQHFGYSDMGLDLPFPKELSQATSKTDIQSAGGGLSSPKGTPPPCAVSHINSPGHGGEKQATAVHSNMKFNGDSSREKLRSDSDFFKVPTPKVAEAEEERSNSGGGAEIRSVSARLPPTSPLSDASSPENELVIDCEDSHSHSLPPSSASASSGSSIPSVVLPSPKRVIELVHEGSGLGGKGRTSPGIQSAKTTTPSPISRTTKNSPYPSPLSRPSPSKNSPLPSSPITKEASANSPCEIDDELMDAALGFGGS